MGRLDCSRCTGNDVGFFVLFALFVFSGNGCLKMLRGAVRSGILDGYKIGIVVNELENWKRTADRNGKGDYGQD